MARISPHDAFKSARHHMGQPFAWGLRSDCTAACVVFADLHGQDPLMGCLDSYSTALGAARILKRADGYLEWCDATFDLVKVDEENCGDLALIPSADKIGFALAICMGGDEFASKSEAGMVITKSKIKGAWTWRS
jgi:hypothetical protein